MAHLRFLTAGESHGKALIGILEGIPSGLSLASTDIDRELRRRQMGYGRGGRMKIENDHAVILSGVRWGMTLGSPISLSITNRDWQNWQEGMSPEREHAGSIPAVTKPRPGHADLSGAMKYDHRDVRNILERSSARETAMRVALGAVAKRFLAEFDILVTSYVIQIGGIRMADGEIALFRDRLDDPSLPGETDESPVRCPSPEHSAAMVKQIDEALQKGDSVGGVFDVITRGVPPALGSHIQWDTRLDGRLAHAVMSIQAIKGVEIGIGFDAAEKFGSDVMDEILYSEGRGFYRETNNAGGIEGGTSNGMPLVIRAAMKPIPTLRKSLRSVEMHTKQPVDAAYERSDVCAVPAAAVIAEAMAALVVADAFIEKFGGDSLTETRRNYDGFMDQLRTL
ncbi:MAG: chorismate synthase [Chloroflexota bacterium]